MPTAVGIKSQEPEYLSGPPHSCSRRAVRDACASHRDAATAKKLLRKKKNESWTMRRFENIRGLTSPTLGVGGNLLCKSSSIRFREHRPLACGVWRLAKHMLSGEPPESARETRALPDPIRCATRLRASRLLRAGSVADSFAELKRRRSQSSFQRRVSIFRSINRPQA